MLLCFLFLFENHFPSAEEDHPLDQEGHRLPLQAIPGWSFMPVLVIFKDLKSVFCDCSWFSNIYIFFFIYIIYVCFFVFFNFYFLLFSQFQGLTGAGCFSLWAFKYFFEPPTRSPSWTPSEMLLEAFQYKQKKQHKPTISNGFQEQTFKRRFRTTAGRPRHLLESYSNYLKH